MTTPAIITVAITGSQPTKEMTAALPVTPSEQIESTHEAFEAGASLVHIHVRDEKGLPSSDPDLYAEVQDGVRKHCPGMIIQFSTGGRGRSMEERGTCLKHRPDMASLATGSVNFKTVIYENSPQLVDDLANAMVEYDIKPEVEVFDLAMLYNTRDLIDRGLLREPAHVQFVMGIPNALPVRERLLDFLVEELAEILPGATWTAAGIGRQQLALNRWSLARGGHVRTGLEDNIYMERGVRAQSTAELVERLAVMCGENGRHAATAEEARQLLVLRTETAIA